MIFDWNMAFFALSCTSCGLSLLATIVLTGVESFKSALFAAIVATVSAAIAAGLGGAMFK